MRKKALALGGGIDQVKLIKEFKSRGFYVIVVDKDINAPGKKYADEFYPISTMEKDKLLEIAQKEQISTVGVMSADQPLLTAAYISEQMGLYYPISYEQAMQVTNKSAMKKILVENNIPTSNFYIASSLKEFELISECIDFPLVVKPVDSSASRGVNIINGWTECYKINEAINASASGKYIIEKLYQGQEISVDAVVKNGEVTIIMITDRLSINMDNKLGLCYGSSYPTTISEERQKQVYKIVKQITNAFSINNSLLFLQMVVNDREVNVIEFSARNGGASKHILIKRVADFDVVNFQIDMLLNETLETSFIHNNKNVILSYIYCKEGKYTALKGVDWLKNNGIISLFKEYKSKGYKSKGIEDGSDRIGVFFVEGNSIEEVKEKLSIAEQRIKILNENNEDIMVHGIYC